MRLRLIVPVILGTVAVVVAGASAQGTAIQLEKPWVRRAPVMGPGASEQSKSAAYVVIRNRGTAADALVSASADAAASVEVHETRNMSGMMMMERVDRIVVPPGGRVELKPGGYHLMLIGLTRALAPGQAVTLTLVFEGAGPVTARAEVR
jgi:periplasmic copper chaperone A